MSEVQLRTKKFTRADYEHMVETGIIGENERVELLRGEIAYMTPESARHSFVLDNVASALAKAFKSGFCVRAQHPLALGKESEPQPDVAVVRGSRADYARAHPRAAVLVVEVASSSLEIDRDLKSGIYARAQIPEYWIVNLRTDEVEVRRNPVRYPSRHGYEDTKVVSRVGTITPLAAPRARVKVASLFD